MEFPVFVELVNCYRASIKQFSDATQLSYEFVVRYVPMMYFQFVSHQWRGLTP